MFKDTGPQPEQWQAPLVGARQRKPAEQARESGPAARLDSIANNSSPGASEPRADKRKDRFSARYFLWDHSTLKRVRCCGRRPSSVSGGVAVRLSGGRAGFAGLQSCGSVWVDPVCNAKIMARRALEIGAAVETWQAEGGGAAMMTFTLRHNKTQRLATLWDVVSKAWAAVTSGKLWVSAQAVGVEGWLRVVEVNIGPNGWHVHIHALLFVAGDMTTDQVLSVHAGMVRRWSAAAKRLGLSSPLSVAQDCRIISTASDEALGQYLAKAQHGYIGHELTNTQSKEARFKNSTVTVWTLLDNARDGIAEACEKWFEYERASKGRRQISWSKGLRERLRLLSEQTDEDIAAEEMGTADDDLLLITAEGWRALVEMRALAECLSAAEVGGLVGLRDWLVAHGIDYEGAQRG